MMHGSAYASGRRGPVIPGAAEMLGMDIAKIVTAAMRVRDIANLAQDLCKIVNSIGV